MGRSKLLDSSITDSRSKHTNVEDFCMINQIQIETKTEKKTEEKTEVRPVQETTNPSAFLFALYFFFFFFSLGLAFLYSC